jgi:hypothetical protein
VDQSKYVVPDIQESRPVVCLQCGAWIVRQWVHTAWHEDLERTLKLKINRENTMDGEQL